MSRGGAVITEERPPSDGERPPAQPEQVAGFTRFRGGLRTVARVGWCGLALLVVLMLFLSIPPSLAIVGSGCPQEPCLDHGLSASEIQSLAAIGLSVTSYAILSLLANLIPPLVYLAVALVLFLRKPDDGMAYFTSVSLVLFGGAAYPDMLLMLADGNAFWAIPYVVLKYLGNVCIMALFFIFPTGVFIPRWTRWVVVFWMIAQVLDVVSTPPLRWNIVSERLSNAPLVLVLAAVLYAQIYRYRRVSNAVQRRQTKWVVFGTVWSLSAILVAGLLVLFDLIPADNVPLVLFFKSLFVLSATLIPVSIGIAILRSNLYDIDFIINRALVYGLVTAILAGVLAVSSDLTKRVFLALPGGSSELAPIVATLIVVAAFDPVRKWAGRVIDARFKYPTRSFGEFGARLREHVELGDPEALLTRFLKEASDRLGARSGAVYLGQGDDLRLVHRIAADEAEISEPPAGLSLPLVHAGRQAGLIALGARADGEAYDDADRRGLAEAGELVAHAIQLADPHRR